MVKREISKSKYLMAFIIASGIFLVGVLVGNFMNNSKFNKINELQQDLRTQVLSLETQYTIASQNPCNLFESDELSSELYKMSDNLDKLEGEVGKYNEDLLDLVEYYSLLEIRHWLFLKEVEKKCNRHLNLILFFYSNNEEKCTDCGTQGFVLSYIRKKYPEERIYVYSFNVDIDNGAINALQRTYNVTKLPAIVINDNNYFGFKDRNDVEEILSIKQNG